MSEKKNFLVVDYVIFGLMLLISALIGVFFGFFRKKKTNTSQDVLLGGRNMGVFPSSLSLLASFMSGITILGNPSEVYNYGKKLIFFILEKRLLEF
jgi:Na+/proline symporter